ncbi:[NiFe]-hydrogenase assembly chaperone HybE [Amphritea balenae]|uniref:[NiFe]-hydrogenase assembly, chaperone, HybE n=1 Tax=Amphritea balenae TaxID=452629 RepID=A0A3P1SWW7_9GAMM|nr:[NiFe]-hydrogenase assembly chaperone HybE [Amphritea balenae]RRD01026.1 [NiFe]-hydrogenase assembly, chaperone, HybE [Amphritea balenae]GGK60617.1 hypothetical protein GCM10007941_08560 [Amphritea balenae]
MITPVAIEQRYEQILHQNMEGVAVVNQHLQVRALGFNALNDEQLGILITPWFMNMMLLPADDSHWDESLAGTKTLRQLPSGLYEFIHGWDAELGGYAICGLFSPMFEFSDQAAAEKTAEEVLLALFDSQNYAPTDRQQAVQDQQNQVSSQLAKGSSAQQGSRADDVAKPTQQEVEHPAKLSRRQFFTGAVNPVRNRSGSAKSGTSKPGLV